MQTVKKVGLTIALLALTGAALAIALSRDPPRMTAGSAKDACTEARSYALTRLAADAYRGVVADSCPLATSQQTDGSWVTVGKAVGTQFGAPVTILWSARTAAFGSAWHRVCSFGVVQGQKPQVPRLLDVSECPSG